MNNQPRFRNHSSILIAGILLLLSFNACLSPPGSQPEPASKHHPWAEALRALDPADAPTPANDLTAVYLREQDDVLQIRVDLLDFKNPKDVFLDIRIEDNAAPQEPPLIIHIPSQSNSFRITLDPLLATVIIEVPLSEIPSHPRVDVSTPEDQITGLTLDGPVPTQTAPLLLTFYDTFAGRFPAEALRSWDGAHTGPRGERHGLKHLLDAVEEYQIPVVLLDLKEPENLSALDAMGRLLRIQQMEQDGLLIMPVQTNTELLFGFSPSPFTWGGMPSRLTFAAHSDPSHIYNPIFSKTTYLPIATESGATQPTPAGPSLEVRRALLETALNNDRNDLLVLGGSFANSTWGSPDMIDSTMAYLASRPYIHILDGDSLLQFPAKSAKPDLLPQQVEPPDELSLQTQSALEFAKAWAKKPYTDPLSYCQFDANEPSVPDCVLANESYFATFDAQNASLTYLFSVERDAIPPYLHQLIGPSWQVAPGIDLYPGAFADVDDPFKAYEPIIEGNTLVFNSLDGTRTKTFRLTDNGIEVEYRTVDPVITQIPLLVDPWTRFTPGWAEKYVQQNTPGGVAWGLENGPMVNIQTDGPMTMRTFNEALDLLAIPEDPDFEYPSGHFVPFPMAIVEVEMQDGYVLRLERLP